MNFCLKFSLQARSTVECKCGRENWFLSLPKGTLNTGTATMSGEMQLALLCKSVSLCHLFLMIKRERCGLAASFAMQSVLLCHLSMMIKRERCQSGRMCSLGKRVWGNSPGVRIPLSPNFFNLTSHTSRGGNLGTFGLLTYCKIIQSKIP